MVSWNYRFQNLRTTTDYLSARIENQNRTLNDRCAFENNIWPVITERLNELVETNTWKIKIYGPTTEEEKLKLLLTTQQNQTFFYHIMMWKINRFFRISHRIYSKNKQTNKTVEKTVVNFTFPRQIFMFYFTLFQTRGFYLLQAVLLSSKTYNTGIL